MIPGIKDLRPVFLLCKNLFGARGRQNFSFASVQEIRKSNPFSTGSIYPTCPKVPDYAALVDE